MKKLTKLKKGDKVAILSPSFPASTFEHTRASNSDTISKTVGNNSINKRLFARF